MKFKELIKKTNNKFTIAYLLLNEEKYREYLAVYPQGKLKTHDNQYCYLVYYRKETLNGKKMIMANTFDIIREQIIRNMEVMDYH